MIAYLVNLIDNISCFSFKSVLLVEFSFDKVSVICNGILMTFNTQMLAFIT